LVIPLFIFVIYRGFVNCLRLVTFPLATVFLVVFVVTFSCIFIKLLSTRRYLISFFRHFCPTGVNTKERLYFWGWMPKSYMDISIQRGLRHRWEGWPVIRCSRYNPKFGCTSSSCHNRFTKAGLICDGTEEKFKIEQYRDYAMVQGLARLVSYLELLGYLIRPVSLSLRLVANISCGHILMVLAVGSVGFSVVFIFGPVLFVCGLETLVCFVQCYVFYTLWCMYMGE